MTTPTRKDWAHPRVAQFMDGPHVAYDGMWVKFASDLAAENDRLRNALSFCEGVFHVIGSSPGDFRIDGVKEARKRIQEAMKSP